MILTLLSILAVVTVFGIALGITIADWMDENR